MLLRNTLIASSLLSGTCLAAEAPKPWAGEAELGLVMTSGNTETQSINAKAKVINERDRWRHTLQLEALNTADQDSTTAERYLATAQSDYKFSKFNYLFLTLRHEDDRFSGYEYRTSEMLGYGRRVIDDANLKLDLEAGPGARQSKPDNASRDNEFIFLLSGDLSWKVSDSATFSENLYTEIGQDATITKSVTGLKAQVNSSLAMKISYTVKHTSEVPAGVENTDTETAMTLVYGF